MAFNNLHFEQHRKTYSTLNKIRLVQEQIEIILVFSFLFFLFWFLKFIQIALKDQNIGLILFEALQV